MTENKLNDIKKIAVIMAGGVGDALWPRSTSHAPKQFSHFIGDGTMIQNTIDRLLPIIDLDDIYIVTDKSLYDVARLQLPDFNNENIIIEPFGKHTAPCLGMAATVLHQKLTDDTIMLAFPSDHIIANIREFHESLETAIEFAYLQKAIVTIGITPTRPVSNFGYVQIREDKDELGDFYEQNVRLTSAFAEKPDLETAKRFVDSGDFLWNSGIFIWRIDTFWEAVKKYLPDHNRLFGIMKKHVGKAFFEGIVEEIYRQMHAESVDFAILEKADNVYVIKSKFSWSDLNNWDEVFRLQMKDARNNFIEGSVIPINIRNCYVSSRDKLISIIGVEDLIVVEDENAIIICRKEKSDDIKEIVDFMQRKHITPYL
jgi:mannose-1-phosphate guanylyltransferase